MEGIGKKKSALIEEITFTKSKVIFNMYKSMVLLMMLTWHICVVFHLQEFVLAITWHLREDWLFPSQKVSSLGYACYIQGGGCKRLLFFTHIHFVFFLAVSSGM